MLPKRKLIKKQFTAPKDTGVDQLNHDIDLDIDSISELLHSTNIKNKHDAITAIANLEDLDLDLLNPSTLIELLNILYCKNNTALVHSCLFALNNICQLYPDPTVKSLFSHGLMKALLQIGSTDHHLIKPIILLMTTISPYTPSNYIELIKGVQSMIISGGLPSNGKDPNPFLNEDYADLVLEFLMRSEYSFESEENPPNQGIIMSTLVHVAETSKSYKTRVMASRLLISLTRAQTLEHIHIFCSVSEEIINDIQLQKEYDANFSEQKNVVEEGATMGKDSPNQEGMDDEEMERKGKKIQFNEEAYGIWIDALEGLQMILEFKGEVLENENDFEDEAEEGDEEEMGEEQIEEQGKGQWNQQIVEMMVSHIENVCKNYEKLIRLNFVEGQAIIELVLKVLLAFPQKHNANLTSYFIYLAENCLITLIQSEMTHPKRIPTQYLTLNCNLCLQVVMKYKQIAQRNIYVELPLLSYACDQAKKVMKIERDWKDCWLSLLEIFSMFYNPEKSVVTAEENLAIGQTLKQLIVEIPEMELEEWRGQAIDTVFDVFSNENFDKNFMELNLVHVLSEVAKHAKSSAKKGKKNKFVSEVLMDIGRFLEYKKKMIGF